MESSRSRKNSTRRRIILWTAVGLSLFQLYTLIPLFPRPNLFFLRSVHLSLVLILTFLLFPLQLEDKRFRFGGKLIDSFLIAASAYSGYYLPANLEAIVDRAGFWTRADIVAGIICVFCLLEACRRVVGIGLTGVAAAAIVYAYTGPTLSGLLAHRGYSTERIIAQLYLGQEGIFGLPLGVAVNFVFIFILFGAFLEATGAGTFFMDLAYALTGKTRGGPAKAAVLTSAFMGSISGSAVANVVTTGTFTIPLMRRLVYRRHEAAGIEAAASTGGQIMPPVMGAGAFLMAELTGIPYWEIVKVSILPALMYFVTVYLFVDILAARRGVESASQSVTARPSEILLKNWHFLLPLLVLIGALVLNYSAGLVGLMALLAVVTVTVGRSLFELCAKPDRSRGIFHAIGNGWPVLVQALETGAKNAIMVILACAAAGIVVGIVGLTGLGLKFSTLMLSITGGNVLLALLVLAVASLVLGLGLPVTASYIVLAVLAAPALTNELGLPLLVAHLAIFWYSQDSNVTPPVALAAFAGAAIAGASPSRTALAAWKFAKGLYLIPAYLVFHPHIVVGGSIFEVAWDVVVGIVAMGAFAAALEGYLRAKLRVLSRLLFAAGLIAIFVPSLTIEIVGLTLIGGGFLLHLRATNRSLQVSPEGLSKGG